MSLCFERLGRNWKNWDVMKMNMSDIEKISMLGVIYKGQVRYTMHDYDSQAGLNLDCIQYKLMTLVISSELKWLSGVWTLNAISNKWCEMNKERRFSLLTAMRNWNVLWWTKAHWGDAGACVNNQWPCDSNDNGSFTIDRVFFIRSLLSPCSLANPTISYSKGFSYKNTPTRPHLNTMYSVRGLPSRTRTWNIFITGHCSMVLIASTNQCFLCSVLMTARDSRIDSSHGHRRQAIHKPHIDAE